MHQQKSLHKIELLSESELGKFSIDEWPQYPTTAAAAVATSSDLDLRDKNNFQEDDIRAMPSSADLTPTSEMMMSVIDNSEIPRFWLRLKFQCASGVSPDTGPGPGYLNEDADGQ